LPHEIGWLLKKILNCMQNTSVFDTLNVNANQIYNFCFENENEWDVEYADRPRYDRRHPHDASSFYSYTSI
jgi:hypothetical protein